MTYIAVMNWDGSSKKVTKSQSFDTLTAAQTFVTAKAGVAAGTSVSAFACEIPQGYDVATWKVNASNNGLEIDQTAADAKTAAATAKAAETTRLSNITGDAAYTNLLSALKTMTNTELKTYIDDTVTDLTSAKTALKRMALILAAVVKRVGM